MKKWIILHLRMVADWLEGEVPIPPTPSLSPLDQKARILVLDWDSSPHTGSFKRAKVMTNLINTFPNERRRDLSLSLEKAIQEVL